jgi:glutathione S-transferase
MKPTLPLGQMPFLEVEEAGKDKVFIPQSVAILRYLGKLGGLYPADPLEAMKVDSVLDTIAETSIPIEMSVQGSVKCMMADEPWTKDQVLEIRKRISTSDAYGLPFFFTHFENILKENGTGWLVGEKVTIADIQWHRVSSWVMSGMLDGIPKDLVDGYPSVKAHHERIEGLPEVVAWRTNYPTPYTDFEFQA